MKTRINNICFIIVFFSFSFFGIVTLMREQKDISVLENRALNKFTVFNISEFLDGTYQDNLEDAYLDQFIGSENIRSFMKTNLNFSKMIDTRACRDSYVHLGDILYTYDCQDYIVNESSEMQDYKEGWFKSASDKYLQLNNYVDTYYYYITTSANYNFKKNELGIDVPALINKYWKGNYSFDYLKIDSFDTFKKYFYKTDHHWNHIGSYQGYKDIISMMGKNDEVLKPVKEITLDTFFYGTRARVLSYFDIQEYFKFYQYNLSEYTSYINGVERPYGNVDNYFNGVYSIEKLENHYHKLYGWDNGETILDFNREDKENLLILSSSYSHPVNRLIASHFNKTHIIDIRHYEEDMGTSFNALSYIQDNNISKVLVLMDIWYVSQQLNDLQL